MDDYATVKDDYFKLIRWHFERGTRPGGTPDDKALKKWTRTELIELVTEAAHLKGVSTDFLDIWRNSYYWLLAEKRKADKDALNELNLPMMYWEYISEAFFGSSSRPTTVKTDDDPYSDWRKDYTTSYDAEVMRKNRIPVTQSNPDAAASTKPSIVENIPGSNEPPTIEKTEQPSTTVSAEPAASSSSDATVSIKPAIAESIPGSNELPTIDRTEHTLTTISTEPAPSSSSVAAVATNLSIVENSSGSKEPPAIDKPEQPRATASTEPPIPRHPVRIAIENPKVGRRIPPIVISLLAGLSFVCLTQLAVYAHFLLTGHGLISHIGALSPFVPVLALFCGAVVSVVVKRKFRNDY